MINAVHLTHLFTRSVNSVNLIENWVFILFILIFVAQHVYLRKQFRNNLPSDEQALSSHFIFGGSTVQKCWLILKFFVSTHISYYERSNGSITRLVQMKNSITGIINLFSFNIPTNTKRVQSIDVVLLLRYFRCYCYFCFRRKLLRLLFRLKHKMEAKFAINLMDICCLLKLFWPNQLCQTPINRGRKKRKSPHGKISYVNLSKMFLPIFILSIVNYAGKLLT